MYNGYTETLERATDRLNARQLRHIEEIYGADWELDADTVRTHIEALDISDWLVENAERNLTNARHPSLTPAQQDAQEAWARKRLDEVKSNL